MIYDIYIYIYIFIYILASSMAALAKRWPLLYQKTGLIPTISAKIFGWAQAEQNVFRGANQHHLYLNTLSF